MNKELNKFWIAVSKTGVVLTFINEPTKEGDKWVGDIYVNSIHYNQINDVVKKSSMTFDTPPQYIELVSVENN